MPWDKKKKNNIYINKQGDKQVSFVFAKKKKKKKSLWNYGNLEDFFFFIHSFVFRIN